MVYATFSQGFRLGKPQPGLPAGVCDVNNDGIVDGSTATLASTKLTRSDETTNYEIGSKFGLLQNRLTGSVAVFLMDWQGVPFRTSAPDRSEEHTSELQSLMRISYAVFCLKKKT